MNKIWVALIGVILVFSISAVIVDAETNLYGHWVPFGDECNGFSGQQPGPEWQPSQEHPYPSDAMLETITLCLKSRATVYIHESCGWCQRQAESFRSSWDDIPAIECALQSSSGCQEISGTPTWEINGTLYPGFKSPLDLALIAGCDW